jgi:Tfp pilus assembly protein PilN
MIRINLAKARKNAGGKIDLNSLNLTSLLQIFQSRKSEGEEKKFDINGPIPRTIIAIVACWLLNDTLEGFRVERMAEVDRQIAEIEKQKAVVNAGLAKMKGYEAIKKQLEDDELSIRTKLSVLNQLLENRNASSKLMLQVAQSIPEEVWLTEFKANNANVKLAGATPGYTQVSDFIKALNGTSQFGEIKLSEIRESVTPNKDQRIQQFELSAARRQVE